MVTDIVKRKETITHVQTKTDVKGKYQGMGDVSWFEEDRRRLEKQVDVLVRVHDYFVCDLYTKCNRIICMSARSSVILFMFHLYLEM